MYEPVTNVTGIVSIGERNEIPDTEDQEDNRNGCFHIENQHRSMIPEIEERCCSHIFTKPDVLS